MTLHKKAGRLMIAGFKGRTMSEEIKHLIHTYHIGGVILFGRNIGTPEEILHLTRSLQIEAKAAGYKVPLLISIDQENGVVRRLGEGTTIIPGAMLLGAAQDPTYSRKAGELTGKELKALGINWNLAPVVDINNNPKNPVIGVRSFGEDPHKVSELAKQSMLGMQDAKVMTTLKHFPGHGDTSVDSHLDLPVISHDLERLHQVELVPFKNCIAAGADAIMSAHVHFPALESEADLPATLSRSVITGLLREELGFEGVVTTDCMEMDAIAKGIGTVNGSVKAVQAGVDLVMVSHLHGLQEQSILKIAEAIENGEIDEEQVDRSIERIDSMIANYVTWQEIEAGSSVPEFMGSAEHYADMKEIYEQGITLAGGTGGSPIAHDDKVLLVYPHNEYATMVEDKRYSTLEMAEQLKNVHAHVEVIEVDSACYEEQQQETVSRAKEFDRLVILTLNAAAQESQRNFVGKLIGTGVPADVVAIRTPYDAAEFPEANRIYCTYEFTAAAFETMAEVLVGKTEIHGKLPVKIV